MKQTDTQDQILRKILSHSKLEKAPDSLKTGILQELAGLSIPVRQKQSMPGIYVLISVAVILTVCLIWVFISSTGSEWKLPNFNPLTIQTDLDLWLSGISSFFNRLFDFNLSSKAGWVYYVGGGILLFWFYFFINMILDKLTQSRRNYSV